MTYHRKSRVSAGRVGRSHRTQTRARCRVPSLESLEPRCMLAVSIGGPCLPEGESAGASSLGLITAEGTTLVDQSTHRPWFFAGANNYYVGVDTLDPEIVDEVMADVKSIGLNALRLWAFNDDQAKPWSRLQGLNAGTFDEGHFRRLDYAIAKAGENGIRVILALTNYNKEYGGMKQYVDWAGDSTPTDDLGENAARFFASAEAQSDYQSFVSYLANRVNTETCRQYKDDPTILLWQLANEPKNPTDPVVSDGSAMSEWIADTAVYLKEVVGVRQLVGVGMEGFYDAGNASKGGADTMDNQGTDFVSQHAGNDIDVTGFHLYPDGRWGTSHDQAVPWIAAHARDSRRDPSLHKPVVMDEFGWRIWSTTVEQRDEYYREYLDAAYRELTNGTAFWRIVDDRRNDYSGSGEPMCNLPPDQRVAAGRETDGLSLCYPGDTSTASVLSQHAQKIDVLNVAGIHQLASFDRDAEEAAVLEGGGYLRGELQRVAQPEGTTSLDGVLKVPVVFTAGDQDLSVGVPLTDLLTGTRGVDVSDYGYISLAARLRVAGPLSGAGDAGLLVKIFDQTGPAYTWSDGAEVRVQESDTWYDLVWPVARAGDLRDLRRLGIKVHSARAFTGDVYLEFLGGDLFSDWHNGLQPEDVDRNGAVIPMDVLRVINKLNSEGSGPVPSVLPGQDSPQFAYDTNGDNLLAPLDALIIINYLNARPPIQLGPAIAITDVPAYGAGGSVRGRVSGVDFASYRVAPYIQIEGAGWWTKPTFATPTVPIAADGTFVANVTTGGIDGLATVFCAALVPAGVTPVQAAGTGRVPADPNRVAIAYEERYGRQIEFAGHTWAVKESPVPVGPGNNRFSSQTDDVFVDPAGLHLTVKYEDGYWRSSEVILLDHLGYGTYTFQTQSRLDTLDPNVTFGAFTWDAFGDDESGADPHREIDFEDSRWGNPSDPTSAQMVIQPYYVAGNLRRYAVPDLDGDPTLTRFFTWRPCRVEFMVLKGRHTPADFRSEDILDQFEYYENPNLGHFVPDEGRESFRFNLWINSDGQPENGQTVEVVIRDFSFTP